MGDDHDPPDDNGYSAQDDNDNGYYDNNENYDQQTEQSDDGNHHGLNDDSSDQYDEIEAGDETERDYERGGFGGVVNGALYGGRRRDRRRNVQQGALSAVIRTFGPRLMRFVDGYPSLRNLVLSGTVVWALMKFVWDHWRSVWTWLMSFALTSVGIQEQSPIYRSMTTFLQEQAVFKFRRAIIAQTAAEARSRNVHQEVDGNNKVVVHGESDFQFFKHDGRWFIYTKESGMMKLWTMGWSATRLNEMVDKIHEHETKKQQARKVQLNIARPNHHYGGYKWEPQPGIDRRDLASVCLPADVKKELVDFIDDYYSEEGKAFYKNNTMPRRLGFLLYGEPGCGKTSFATAVASEYNLTIYSLSLRHRNMTDSVLQTLFKTPGERSMILLEDIDSAGIGREFKEDDEASSDSTDSETTSDSETEDDAVKKKRAIRKRKLEEAKKKQSKPEPPSQVTYSGLLNVTDGTNAPTGTVIIMTTNKRHVLEDALIRDGRADMQVEFKLACKEQMRDLFINIMTPIRKPEDYDPEPLLKLAREFATKVPEDTFSPAAIQQYCKINR